MDGKGVREVEGGRRGYLVGVLWMMVSRSL